MSSCYVRYRLQPRGLSPRLHYVTLNAQAQKVFVSKTMMTRKALTRGRTDRFAASITYLQFPLFRPALFPCRRHWFSQFFIFAFRRKKEHFVPVTLNFAMTWPTNLTKTKLNHRAKYLGQSSYLGQMSFCWTVIVRTHTLSGSATLCCH